MTIAMNDIALELTKIITTLMEATGNEDYSQRNVWMTIRYIRDMTPSSDIVGRLTNSELIEVANGLIR